jgi:predicted regulator of Ras-like GTPase activity (Roadblock/LC7/MglB family)
MLPPSHIPTQVPLPLDTLVEELNRTATDLNAVCVLATDDSGGLLGVSDTHTSIDLQTLAALGTANLASAMQLLSLTEASSAQRITSTLVEDTHTRLFVAGKPGGLMVIALLGPHTPLGLARIEVSELADKNWEIPSHTFSNDHTQIEQELASHDLFDDLFNLPGDDPL